MHAFIFQVFVPVQFGHAFFGPNQYWLAAVKKQHKSCTNTEKCPLLCHQGDKDCYREASKFLQVHTSLLEDRQTQEVSQLQVDPQENRGLVLKLMEFLDLLAQKDKELKRREDYLQCSRDETQRGEKNCGKRQCASSLAWRKSKRKSRWGRKKASGADVIISFLVSTYCQL